MPYKMLLFFYELTVFFLEKSKKSSPQNNHAGKVMKDKKTSKVTDIK